MYAHPNKSQNSFLDMSSVNSESQLLYHQHVTVTCSKLLPVCTYVFPFLSQMLPPGQEAWEDLSDPPT